MIAPFSKKPLDLTMKGVTTDDKDLSVREIGRHLRRTLCSPTQGGYDPHGDTATSRVIWYFGRT